MVKDGLAVIMPVYNEAEIINEVLAKWLKELSGLGIDFSLHVYNDGSRDNSREVLDKIALQDYRVIVHHKVNSGHGPTLIQGYCENLHNDWIFQVDSDDEIMPWSFAILWSKKNNYDFLIGRRGLSSRPFSRKIISLISRFTTAVFYGKGISDVNSPCRLMRVESIKDVILSLPKDTFAPNIILSGMACRKELRILELPVPHRNRRTGEASIKKGRLLLVAVKSLLQIIQYRLSTHAA